MKITEMPRGSGKTTRLIYESSYKNIPIICSSMSKKQYIYDLADKRGVVIPEPITVKQYLKLKNPPKRILIDEVFNVLSWVFDLSTIEEVTYSKEDF